MMGGLQSKLGNTECVDEFIISHRNKVMATKAWFRIAKCYRNHPYKKDIQAGFMEGYMEVATGGSGCTPTVVSPQYWGWKHQCHSGQAAVNAWFEGFPLGVKAAEEDGIGAYNMIRLQNVPFVNTSQSMNGSMAPTPAADCPAPVAPARPVQQRLPPGIVLGEGETLVPGQITFAEPGSEPIETGGGDDAGPNTNGEGPTTAPTPDPFSDDGPAPPEKEDALDQGLGKFQQPTRFTPRSFTVSTPVEDVSEPSQDEINSAIEGIFGRTTPDDSASSRGPIR